MEAKINRSELMKRAHSLKKVMGYETFSQALKHSWLIAKNELEEKRRNVENEAIRQIWKKQAEAKRQAERQIEENKFVTSGLDFHTYTMTNLYKSVVNTGD